MAEEFLQGVQIGSNLFDRAQTQRRLQEQAQVQLGQLAIQQQQADMQQKMQQLALSDAIEEKRFQAEDTPQYYQFQKEVQNYLSNPSAEAPLPSVPQFRSKAFRAEGDATLKQLSQYSNRAVAMKQMDATRQLLSQAANNQHRAFNEDIQFGLEHGGPEFLAVVNTLPNNGFLPNGTVDPNAHAQIRSALAPIRAEVEKRKQDLEKQRLSGGVTATNLDLSLKALADSGLLNLKDAKQVADARPWAQGRAKTTTKDLDIINNGDQAVSSLDRALEDVKRFDTTYRNTKFKDFIGPFDNPTFRAKGMLQEQQTAAERDANQILITFKDAISNYRKGLYGATLTPNEQKELESVVSTAKRGDYVTAMSQFKDILARNVGTAVRRNRYSPSIDSSLKQQYAPDVFVGGEAIGGGVQGPRASETVTETPSGAVTTTQELVLPPGWKFTQ